MSRYLIEIFVFVFGLCIGSFMNVCIYRLPASKSVIHPPSMCPNCGSSIRFYDNIPVLSYLLLGGRCRHCKVPVSLRYPLVELMSGVFALGVLMKFGLTLEALVYYGFIAVLLLITFIDLDHQIIPDVITLPGIPIGFIAALALPTLTYTDSILGLIAGGGSLFIVAWTYNRITGKDGMGGGDIKLLAMIGTLLGWQGVLFTIFVSSAVGTLAGIIVMLRTRKGMKLAIPFGPFLAIGAIAYVFLGPALIAWYLGLLQ